MSRQDSILGVVLLGVLAVMAGCSPQQPFYFCEDGDLSHYIDKATEIEYPDVESVSLDEVTGAIPPLTLDNPDPSEIWELTLEEAVKYALENSKVIRALPGPIPQTVDRLQTNPDFITTVYDPAVVETHPRGGVEAALAAFDAQLTSSMYWEKNDTPQNIAGAFTQFRPNIFQQELGTFQAQLRKTAATGGTWFLTHNVRYEWNNVPVYDILTGGSRQFASDYNVNLEAEFRQPLLQGAGVQFNRITGPGAIPGYNAGVMIARVNTDISLADFEGQVRNLVNDVERAYWELYFAYRQLNAYVEARDRALDAWREQKAAFDVGGVQDRLGRTRGKKEDVALARHQVYQFRGLVEQTLSQLYSVENNLRYMLGLTATDGRLIRPADEPTTAKVEFDWYETHGEAMVRSLHLRRQKWQIKRRELELIAAKNYLLPRLDSVGRYRWRGFGDHLIDPGTPGGVFNNAYQTMTEGNYQEWYLGLEMSLPLGFRKELAGVRHAQLNMARERAVLQEMELEVSHGLTEALRDLEKSYALCQTFLNRIVAAQEELEVWEAIEKAGMTVDEDRRLLAQQRLAEAQISYYQALKSYNLAIAQIHFRKGSLLEYNGVYLTEGPWPAKAYFDATRRARARDASFYLDYGFTRPKVLSRGPYDQHAGLGDLSPGVPEVPVPPDGLSPETLPLPRPEPFGQFPTDQLPAELEPFGQLPADQLPAKLEPFSVLEKAGPESAGPRLGNTPPVLTTGQTRPKPNGDNYDLGSLDLEMFAANPAEVRSTSPVPRSSIQPAGYQQTGPPSDELKPQHAESTWKSSKTSGTRHESVANPPTAEADRNASGWQRVQR